MISIKDFASTTLQQLWRLTPGPQRRALPFLGVLCLFGAFLEALGIGLLIPLLNLMTGESYSPQDSVFGLVFEYFGAESRVQMLTVGFLLIGVVVLLKSIFLALVFMFQSSQAASVRSSIETQLFERYLYRDYVFHLNTNSAVLMKNLITEVEVVFARALLPAFVLVVESLTIVGVLALLVFVEPIPTLALFLFLGTCGAIYSNLISPTISNLGRQREVFSGEAFRTISETMGGIREIKSFGRENFFWSRFQIISRGSVRVAARTETVNKLPTHLVELAGVFGLLVIVFTLFLQGRSESAVVSSLGLFVGASLRFIPAFNRILIALHSINLAKPAVDNLFNEITNTRLTDVAENKVKFPEELQFHDVCFSYGSDLRAVINRASFGMKQGDWLGIIGSSGAGKSTLVALLLGLLRPTSGHISADGERVELSQNRWRSHVGYVPQEVFLLDDTIRKNIAFGVTESEISDEKIQTSISRAQLTEFIATLNHGVHTIVGERGVKLSGGQKQRIGIARALYVDPKLLVLDESTSALDLETEDQIIETLQMLRGQVTMVVISHRASTLKFCDRILQLESGTLIQRETPSHKRYNPS